MVVVVYYSGHGVILNNDENNSTWIQHIQEGDYTDIQSYVTELAEEPNTLVFSIIDCCRSRRDAKGPSNTKVREKGQLYIAFSS